MDLKDKVLWGLIIVSAISMIIGFFLIYFYKPAPNAVDQSMTKGYLAGIIMTGAGSGIFIISLILLFVLNKPTKS